MAGVLLKIDNNLMDENQTKYLLAERRRVISVRADIQITRKTKTMSRSIFEIFEFSTRPNWNVIDQLGISV